MIVLQILLVPGVVFFLLIGTFVIGSLGVEHSEPSAPTVQDVPLVVEPNSIWTSESIGLSYQSQGPKESYLEQIGVLQTGSN